MFYLMLLYHKYSHVKSPVHDVIVNGRILIYSMFSESDKFLLAVILRSIAVNYCSADLRLYTCVLLLEVLKTK